jgi:hypothetical protein
MMGFISSLWSLARCDRHPNPSLRMALQRAAGPCGLDGGLLHHTRARTSGRAPAHSCRVSCERRAHGRAQTSHAHCPRLWCCPNGAELEDHTAGSGCTEGAAVCLNWHLGFAGSGGHAGLGYLCGQAGRHPDPHRAGPWPELARRGALERHREPQPDRSGAGSAGVSPGAGHGGGGYAARNLFGPP